MLSISRILVPVDFSDRCLGMIPYVKEVARKYRSEILLLYVVRPLYAIPETGVSALAIVPVPRALLADESERLDQFSGPDLDGFPVRRLVSEGIPEEQIVAIAQKEDVQLVIMATHGYGVFRRFLIGSVTSKVLHDVHCPVLTGTHSKEHHGISRVKISTIACAIDLGPNSGHTLQWASTLAGDFQSTLSIVHVTPRLEPSLRVVFSSDLKAQMEEMVRNDIEKLQMTSAAKQVTICIQEGDIAHTVSSHAASVGADLVVIGRGTSGQTGRLRTKAYGIIQESPCPVLSV
jgi:nucleotide-binding universal stress UspA family protein